ncbi:rhomboid family intramembrane serine protease [Alphaproteobacteria bacterium]|nr:rhomboid family intramembrane serine protease [Alphaproteobacteria bacterium]
MIPIYDDNPALGKPLLVITIIAVCIIIWFWQSGLNYQDNNAVIVNFGLTPKVFLSGPLLSFFTLFTSMFMHGGFMHLAGNMLYLWIFGDNIEGALGHFRFILFYFLCGTAAAFTQILSAPDSTIPMIGASGAVSGVLGAYLIFYPRARIRTFVFLGIFITFLRLPAVLLLGFWILGQVISAVISNPGSPGVAWFAHLGGFFMGMLLAPLLKKPNISIFQKSRIKVKEKPIKIRFRK